jgi:transcriptional regulator with XRE-family HTH domain
METLGEYVSRIMEEKNLRVKEIERRAGGVISDSYITNITNGLAKNLTVEKLKALAIGLDVDEEELFKVARGVPIEGMSLKTFTQLMNKVAGNSELIRIVKALTKAKPAKVKAILRTLEKD